MKRKILKIITVLLLLALLTMPNFIYVGIGLASYAVSSTATNHQNIEFSAELKEGNILSLIINVKKDGYFNGEITLENSNFTFGTETNSPYIDKIESNKIFLNQINAGTYAQIDLVVNPVSEERFNAGLLNMLSRIILTGIYKDGADKDFDITGTQEVEFKYTEDNTNENVENTARIITNKILKISGEEKRVIQLEMNLGLKENNYPIKEIEVDLDVPIINGHSPKIVNKVDFNNMTHYSTNYEYNSEKSRLQLKMTNEPKNENKINWKKQGNEKIVFTFIYDKDAKIENARFIKPLDENAAGQPITKITLYNEKQLSSISNVSIIDFIEEKEDVISVNTTNNEETIYKGKLYAKMDRQYESKTNIAVNLANAGEYIDIKESTDKTVFNQTVIKKASFDKIFGEDGKITILNENSNIIATIDNETEANESENIVIDYEGNEPKLLEIKTTVPVKEGNLELINTKTIKAEDSETFKNIEELVTKTTYEYFANDVKENQTSIKLEETKTEAILKSSITNFSTLNASDNVQFTVNLLSNIERYDLYKNPSIDIVIPKILNVNVKKVTLLNYQDQFELSYNISNEDQGTIIHIKLEGEQTSFANNADRGININISADVFASNILPSQNSEILMNYTNENKEEQEFKNTLPIKLSSKEGTLVVNKISGYKGEEVTENIESEKTIELEKSTEVKTLKNEVYIINNNAQSMKDTSVILKIPGNSNGSTFENTLKSISVEGINVDKILYSNNIEEDKNSGNWLSYDEIKEKNMAIRSVKVAFENEEILDTQVAKLIYIYNIPQNLKQNDYSYNKVDVYYTINGIETSISSKYNLVLKSVEDQDEEVQENNQKPNNPEDNVKENEENGLKVEQIATSGNNTISVDNIVTEGQGIKYTIKLTNLKNEEIQDIKVIATNKNAIYFNTVKEIEKIFDRDEEVTKYKEDLNLKSKELEVGTIKPGETKEISYQIAVSEVQNNDQVLSGNIKITGNGIDEQTFEMQSNKIAKGSLKLNLEFAYDENVYIGAGDGFPLILTVKNISNQKLTNVKVKLPLTDKLSFSTKYIDANYKDAEFVENNKEGILFNIPSIESGKEAKIGIKLIVNEINVKEDISQYFVATTNNRDYTSNYIEKTVYNNVKHLDLKLSSNIEEKTVKNGQNIIYYIDVENNDNVEVKGILTDVIPYELILNSVKKISKAGEEEIKLETKTFTDELNLEQGEKARYVIDGTLNTDYAESDKITNVAQFESEYINIKSNELVYLIEKEGKENPDDIENPDDSNDKEKLFSISGVAFEDVNNNGMRDSNEPLLSGLTVILMNEETGKIALDSNNKKMETTTSNEGAYSFENLNSGKYTVLFKFDVSIYNVAEFRKSGIDESNNSDVVYKDISLDNGSVSPYASTESIDLSKGSLKNIDAGFVKKKKFDLKLDKTITKTIVQNAEGIKQMSYEGTQLAKIEVRAKQMSNTTVIVEYTISVTNEGELAGYASEIIDYIPEGLKFSSNMNASWYQGTEGYLLNRELANTLIQPGETKSVILTLSKAMTSSNTGTAINTAEINKASNHNSADDIDSTPGNKDKKEDDISSAELIISIGTGSAVTNVLIIFAVVIIIGVGIVFIKRKILNNGKKIV